MQKYTITQSKTEAVLYDGPATSERDALDRMARAAGYRDYASIPPEIGGGDTLEINEDGVWPICACSACDRPAAMADGGGALTDDGGVPTCDPCYDWERIGAETCVCHAEHHGRYEWTG